MQQRSEKQQKDLKDLKDKLAEKEQALEERDQAIEKYKNKSTKHDGDSSKQKGDRITKLEKDNQSLETKLANAEAQFKQNEKERRDVEQKYLDLKQQLENPLSPKMSQESKDVSKLTFDLKALQLKSDQQQANMDEKIKKMVTEHQSTVENLKQRINSLQDQTREQDEKLAKRSIPSSSGSTTPRIGSKNYQAINDGDTAKPLLDNKQGTLNNATESGNVPCCVVCGSKCSIL